MNENHVDQSLSVKSYKIIYIASNKHDNEIYSKLMHMQCCYGESSVDFGISGSELETGDMFCSFNGFETFRSPWV